MELNRKPTRYAHCDGHTDVCYSLDGEKLITCGADGDIRIWTGFDDDDPYQTCVGEWALSIRHKDNHLYVATDSNNVQIMTYPEAERNGILSRFTAPVNHIAVGKSHNLIALVADDMEVKIIELNDEGVTGTTHTFSELQGPPLSVALNHNGEFIAVSSGDGFLRIWNVSTKEEIKKLECVPKINSFSNAKLLCRIDFDHENSLAYPLKSSVVVLDCNTWKNKYSLSCKDVEASFSIVQFSPCGKFLAAASIDGDIIVWDVGVQNIVGVSKSDRPLAISALIWNPKGNNELAFCDVQGQLGIVTFTRAKLLENVADDAASENQNEVDFDGFQFDDDDDDEAISIEKLKREVMGNPESEADKASSRVSTPRPRTPEVPLQAPFMPSSTPEHLNPRYLCWNEVGVVRCYGNDAGEDQNKSIEVEFHDSNLHNSMMMQNFQEYTMGTVSNGALVVANNHQISTIPLGAGSKEWSLNTLDEEEILCIACSESLVCFATSTYLLRVSSLYGTQKAVLSIPGPIVSMAAQGHFLLIAFHDGPARKNDQCIKMQIIKLEDFSVESKDIHCSLRPETSLFWLGFTDTGTPAMMDSSGLLSLYPMSANTWLPFCDTVKHQVNLSDGFFVTAVFESYQAVRGIRCRGSSYPSFTPRPVLTEIPLQPPFIEPATEKAQMEANLFAWSALNVNDVEKKFKETALKTFALACKNNLDQRALELVEMIGNSQLVTLATKYATKLERRRLAEKLLALAERIENETDEDDMFTKQDAPVRTNITKKNESIDNSIQSPVIATHLLQKYRKSVGTNHNHETTVNDSKLDESVGISSTSKTLSLDVTAQDATICKNEPKNPFLKSLKKNKPESPNPLNLTDIYAGYKVEEQAKENRNKSNILNSDKRKQPETDSDKPKGKQRKLEKFMFSKRKAE